MLSKEKKTRKQKKKNWQELPLLWNLRLLDVNKAAKNGDALALDFMENRRKEYFSKAEARKAVKKYSKADFYRLISVVE